MAVLGKVAASAITNENTLALANITFDFSIFKVDAPKVNPPILYSLVLKPDLANLQ